jgi:hypothetical protein
MRAALIPPASALGASSRHLAVSQSATVVTDGVAGARRGGQDHDQGRPVSSGRSAVRVLVLVIAVLAGGWQDAHALDLGSAAPEIAGGPWINSAPLTMAGLRGRVVLVEFWTYG